MRCSVAARLRVDCRAGTAGRQGRGAQTRPAPFPLLDMHDVGVCKCARVCVCWSSGDFVMVRVVWRVVVDLLSLSVFAHALLLAASRARSALRPPMLPPAAAPRAMLMTAVAPSLVDETLGAKAFLRRGATLSAVRAS